MAIERDRLFTRDASELTAHITHFTSCYAVCIHDRHHHQQLDADELIHDTVRIHIQYTQHASITRLFSNELIPGISC